MSVVTQRATTEQSSNTMLPTTTISYGYGARSPTLNTNKDVMVDVGGCMIKKTLNNSNSTQTGVNVQQQSMSQIDVLFDNKEQLKPTPSNHFFPI